MTIVLSLISSIGVAHELVTCVAAAMTSGARLR
jgi:hypothetical protein